MSKKTLLMVAVALILGLPLLGLVTNPSMMPRRMDSNRASQPMYAQVSESKMGSEPSFQDFTDTRVIGRPAPMPNEQGSFAPTPDRTIVKTGTLAMLVKDTRQAVEEVHGLVKSNEGYVTASNVTEDQFSRGVVQADMSVRVPVANLEKFLTEVKKVAQKVTSEHVTASDQTEQKIDIEAQLKNLRATETQLLTIMKQAKTVDETLQVQREVTTVRDSIERMQAQLENLTGSAAMSSVRISLSTKESELPVVESGTRTIGEEIKAAVRSSISLYRSAFVAGMRIAILLLPIAVVATTGWWLVNKRLKTGKK